MRFEFTAALALIGCALAGVAVVGANANAIASDNENAHAAAATNSIAAETDGDTSEGAPPALRVMNAWIRWLPANLPAAGYATLDNGGDSPIVLVGVSSPDYGDLSIHRTVSRAGNTEMLPVDELVIAPHSTVNFAAAGYHLMLMQPTKPHKPGDRVPITLRFADGSSLRLEFDVRKPDAG